MKNKHRLPSHIKPERYQLTIKPDLNGFVFEGEETIYLKLEKAVKEITLHAKELDIQNVELRIKNYESKIESKNIFVDSDNETVKFVFNQTLPKGRAKLHIKFKGILNDKMRGFYRSRYEHQGVEKHLATTQFEATDARRAFPCFDEPSHKAIFDVSVIVPERHTVVSNSIELESELVPEHGTGFKLVKFAPTPKMSTYLLAFIVGDLEYLESQTKRGVKVRVFTTPGKKHQAKFALECASKTLDFYEKYFDIKYPLPVLDMIAIPDFTSGAMENWGAITYRESALLVDDEHSSAQNKQWVALVIAHEIAHQWFGNLVTMHWWTDLWLNEGFASYIEYLAVNKIFPKWDIWSQFMSADLGPAFKLDALYNTHPIEVEVKHPDEISEIFDAVSYSKGASVIRMLAEYLGEKDFKMGLRHYLKKHAYKNTNTADLWKSFEKISKKPVAKIMRDWTKKPGYPVVSVSSENGELNLKQKRFFSSRIYSGKKSTNAFWRIPISIFGKNFSKNILLSGKKGKFQAPNNGWFKLNKNETALFRTLYQPENLEKLKVLIQTKKLSLIDRLGIIRDLFALAESGYIGTSKVLDFVQSYKQEIDYTVWLELAFGLQKLDSLFFSQPYHNGYKKYALKIFEPIAKKIGWKKLKNESHTQNLLRGLILYCAGAFGHKNIIKTAQRQFRQKQTDPDIRSAVYKIVAENGSKTEHSKLLKMYQQTKLHEEKNRIGHALGCFKQKDLLIKTLNFSKNAAVRAQDMPGILVSVWLNPFGKDLAWEFVKKNIKFLLDRFALGGHMLSRILSAGGGFTNKKIALDFKNFFKKHPKHGAERTVEQVIEKIYSNSEWLKDENKNLLTWFSKNHEK